MAAAFHFEATLPFAPGQSAETLRSIPAAPGIFALYGADRPGQPAAQPYLTRAADLRRRVTRLLAPPEPAAEARPAQSKRLNLRDKVASIAYSITGSEFESTLALYHAAAAVFGLAEARRRLRLHTPYCLRFTAENAHPRVYSTNRLSKRGLAHTYGPFPSRAAADRYCDAVLDLFQLRRCHEELAPYPEHPGCVYGEMRKCLAPCNQAWMPEGAAAYAREAAAVEAFFNTRGESMLSALAAEREQASSEMDFERAAALHAQHQRVKAAAALADEVVQPIPKLKAVVVQKAAELSGLTAAEREPVPGAALFLLRAGCIAGPTWLSTLGVRAVKEQTSVGSSLFAQPLMLQAVPLAEADGVEAHAAPLELTPAESPEVRAGAVIAALEERTATALDLATLSDHLSLLRRWYYRPEKQRVGEVFFANGDGSWPVRRILRGAARMALGEPAAMAETQRALAQRNRAGGDPSQDDPNNNPSNGDSGEAARTEVKMKVLHAGRPGVERLVPDLASVEGRPAPVPSFRSRRRTAPE